MKDWILFTGRVNSLTLNYVSYFYYTSQNWIDLIWEKINFSDNNNEFKLYIKCKCWQKHGIDNSNFKWFKCTREIHRESLKTTSRWHSQILCAEVVLSFWVVGKSKQFAYRTVSTLGFADERRMSFAKGTFVARWCNESIRLLQLSKLWNSMQRICMLIRWP